MLTPEEVAHVARLARLELAPDALDLMGRQLTAVLGHIDMLNAVDTSAVSPTAQVFDLRDVLRPDQARPPFPPELMLANAPSVSDGLFKVPAVLEAAGDGS